MGDMSDQMGMPSEEEPNEEDASGLGEDYFGEPRVRVRECRRFLRPVPFKLLRPYCVPVWGSEHS